ncbi:hypothetical protein WR25_00774 [Diploscapter pachys]|uniref:Saposin B-type domain-containing protein n=1 Tax=Diploscapter pachys TaxID=2018661 RepID=A0A2A2KHU8_9BILA|nr:hypothetical protein WR25_00774 [Diploscapter pachys]
MKFLALIAVVAFVAVVSAKSSVKSKPLCGLCKHFVSKVDDIIKHEGDIEKAIDDFCKEDVPAFLVDTCVKIIEKNLHEIIEMMKYNINHASRIYAAIQFVSSASLGSNLSIIKQRLKQNKEERSNTTELNTVSGQISTDPPPLTLCPVCSRLRRHYYTCMTCGLQNGIFNVTETGVKLLEADDLTTTQTISVMYESSLVCRKCIKQRHKGHSVMAKEKFESGSNDLKFFPIQSDNISVKSDDSTDSQKPSSISDQEKHKPMIGACGDTVCATCQPKSIHCPKCNKGGAFREATVNYTLLSSIAALEGTFEEDEPGNNGLESRLPRDDPEEQQEPVIMRDDFGPAEAGPSNSGNSGQFSLSNQYNHIDRIPTPIIEPQPQPRPSVNVPMSLCTKCFLEFPVTELALSKSALKENNLAYDSSGELVPLLTNTIPDIYIDQLRNEQRCMKNCIQPGDAIRIDELVKKIEKNQSGSNHNPYANGCFATSSCFEEIIEIPRTRTQTEPSTLVESQIAKLVRLHEQVLEKFNQIEEKAKPYYSSESTLKKLAEIPELRNVVSSRIDATVKELEEMLNKLNSDS